jgi:hypothetical protein
MDALSVFQQDPRSAVARASSKGIDRLIQHPAAIRFLFDCDNLDFAAVHLQGLTGLLSNELMGKRGHIGDGFGARIRLVLADDPERLATTVVAQKRDPGAERDRRRARGLRLRDSAATRSAK